MQREAVTVGDQSDPEGGVAGKNLLLAFDVDCGQVVPGRHLHLRDLRDEGHWPDRLGNRLPDDVRGSWQMVSLDWEIVPAVREDDPDAAKWYQHDIAEVQYPVDPPLGWDLRNASGIGGGTVDATPGQPSSHGTYGAPYPLPANARQVSFTVIPHLDRRPSDERGRERSSSVIEGSPHPAGQVVMDVVRRTARWEPCERMERQASPGEDLEVNPQAVGSAHGLVWPRRQMTPGLSKERQFPLYARLRLVLSRWW